MWQVGFLPAEPLVSLKVRKPDRSKGERPSLSLNPEASPTALARRPLGAG